LKLNKNAHISKLNKFLFKIKQKCFIQKSHKNLFEIEQKFVCNRTNFILKIHAISPQKLFGFKQIFVQFWNVCVFVWICTNFCSIFFFCLNLNKNTFLYSFFHKFFIEFTSIKIHKLHWYRTNGTYIRGTNFFSIKNEND
jgi:hypothetical protein